MQSKCWNLLRPTIRASNSGAQRIYHKSTGSWASIVGLSSDLYEIHTLKGVFNHYAYEQLLIGAMAEAQTQFPSAAGMATRASRGGVEIRAQLLPASLVLAGTQR